MIPAMVFVFGGLILLLGAGKLYWRNTRLIGLEWALVWIGFIVCAGALLWMGGT